MTHEESIELLHWPKATPISDEEYYELFMKLNAELFEERPETD